MITGDCIGGRGVKLFKIYASQDRPPSDFLRGQNQGFQVWPANGVTRKS